MLYGKEIRIIFVSPSHKEKGRFVIGKDNDMPWRGLLSSDMKRFVGLTKGQSLVMGRKTFYSIPEEFRPFDKNLPLDKARQSIVITKDQDFAVNDPRVVVAHSMSEAVRLAKSKTVWVIGGAEIYALALKMADFLHHTIVFGRFRGDTFFPRYNKKLWEMVSWKDFRCGRVGTEKDKIDSGYMVSKRKR